MDFQILIEFSVNTVLIPIMFKIFDPNLSRGLSFLFNSFKSLKYDTPFAFAATKNIIKNSSIALVLYFVGQLIGLKWFLDQHEC